MTKYIVGKNGLFAEYENLLFSGVLKAEGDPTAEEVREAIRYRFRKIPIRLLRQALAFAEYGKSDRNSEVALVLTYDNGVYKWECPEQWNSMGHVCAHPEKEENGFFNWVGDWHSHPGSGYETSSHSMTDERDEYRKGNGIFIVTSGTSLFSAYPRVIGMFQNRRFEIPIEYVFDDRDDDPTISTFPDEWREKVHGAPCDVCKDIDKSLIATASKPTGNWHGDSFRNWPATRSVRVSIDDDVERAPRADVDKLEEIHKVVAKLMEKPDFDAAFFLRECYEAGSNNNGICATCKGERVKCTVCDTPITEDEIVESVIADIENGLSDIIKQVEEDEEILEDPLTGSQSELYPGTDTPVGGAGETEGNGGNGEI